MTTAHQVTEALHCVSLDKLMCGYKKIILQHGQRSYFLTITRKGNLILTLADQLTLATKTKLV